MINRTLALSFLLLSAVTSSAQIRVAKLNKQVLDPIESYRNDLLKTALEDPRFVGGYLLYLNFFHDFNVVAMENISSRIYKPKVSQRLLNYYLDGLDDINQTLSDEYYERGQGRIDSMKYAEAMTDFDHALQYTPKNSAAYSGRAVLFIFSHQYDEARVELNKAQKFDDKNPEVPFNRGVIFFDEGKLKEAVKEIDSSINLQPVYARAYFEKGLILEAMGNPGEAIKNLRKARSLSDPDAGKVIREIKEEQKKPKKS